MKTDNAVENDVQEPIARASAVISKSVDWYAEGQSRTVEIDGVQIVVRFVGRKGRRGRIAIEAPAGAVFQSAEQRSK